MGRCHCRGKGGRGVLDVVALESDGPLSSFPHHMERKTLEFEGCLMDTEGFLHSRSMHSAIPLAQRLACSVEVSRGAAP